MDESSLSHTRWNCTYHLVFTPKFRRKDIVQYLKGKSTLMIFEHHANLKYKYGKREFWSRGYYVSTVGLNKATIKKYIREREDADQIIDRVSVREAENPFREQLRLADLKQCL
ncbi:transposase [uncultured Sphaerochaeta sp.]|uniref:transposase n=1 Tax=uncultured Sphaerochaeta sp. TaxID=886478 RepID=UPI002A0A9B9E|nr:transposase [uncultured Sphaerochaeta sp.]